MTSASCSDRPPSRRSLAVYQVPPPPPGWEGCDLVRIVDPLGLGAAWLDAAALGSVVALHLRPDPADDWTSHVAPGTDALIAISTSGSMSVMRQRDPISASFRSTDGDVLADFWFEDGSLRISVPATINVTIGAAFDGSVEHHATDDITRRLLRLSARSRDDDRSDAIQHLRP